jgi:sarcosine oxidase subunit alpha
MSAQSNRAPAGGGIDRSQPINFTFDGRRLTGYAGDTLASALLANGIKIVGRSFKYHRPRGIFAAGNEEPNALVGIGIGDRFEPNLKATQVELYEGLVATSQNRFPSLSFDFGGLVNLLSPVFPAGFYYKTFMWPGSWWMLYERFIRKAAGLGKAGRMPDPDHYAKRTAYCDVLVVGSGPAGLAAASVAAKSGARVIVVDENPELGGSLLYARPDAATATAWLEAARQTLDAPNVRVLTRTTAFGYYDHNLMLAIERLTDHLPNPPASLPRQRLWSIRAKRVILATGALERPLVFPGNDRPGVMLASAAERYARQFAVLPGRRVVLFTNNDGAYGCIPALADAGGSVTAVVDTRTGGPGETAAALAATAGAQVVAGAAVVATYGHRGIKSIDVATLSGGTPGPVDKQFDCDLLLSSGGWNPTVHLFSQSQGKLRFDDKFAAFVPATSWQAEQSAGAANGTFETADCIAEGAAAGLAALEVLGLKADAPALPATAPREAENALEAVWAIPSGEGVRHQKAFVDLQNDVTADDVGLAAREGYVSVEHVKRYTTLGMGTDQGRTSNVNGLAILAAHRGDPIPAVGTTTFRPPFTPVTIGAFAGFERGAHLVPVRCTPMHDWHVAAGAVFTDAVPWKRPKYYPKAGESADDAIKRESKAVRAGVGMVDVSTLGKIDVRGRDAAEFLHRIYANRIRNLTVGMCRYGIMLREDGFVFDDGTASRTGESEFYVTASTGKAAAVLQHLEFYAQTVWPELHVHITSVTDQYAGIALAGPKSRDVLADMFGAAEVSNDSLPFMGTKMVAIDGMPVRLFRMTFSGERAFELHTPARFGPKLWQKLLDVGASRAITPYGTEAMNTLRIEKGHVAGLEIDGRTLASDFDFERMLKPDDDFVGKKSLARPALDGTAMRKKLVGLKSLNGKPVPRGGQIVADPAAPRPMAMLGHVTSTCYSPHVGANISLGLVVDREAWLGKTLHAVCEMTFSTVPVEVTDAVFIDPEGGRPRG